MVNEDVIISLNDTWAIPDGKKLENSLIVIPSGKQCDLQEQICKDNCVKIRKITESDQKCRLVFKTNGNQRISKFVLISEAKFVEIHINEHREYLTVVKGEHILSEGDIFLFQTQYSFSQFPNFFSITLLPKNPSNSSIWLFGILLEMKTFEQASLFNSNDVGTYTKFINELKDHVNRCSNNSLNTLCLSQLKTYENKNNLNLECNVRPDYDELKSYIDSRFEEFEKRIFEKIEQQFAKLESNLYRSKDS